jgi:hypothetical protein
MPTLGPTWKLVDPSHVEADAGRLTALGAGGDGLVGAPADRPHRCRRSGAMRHKPANGMQT